MVTRSNRDLFNHVVQAAVDDFIEHGYDSKERLDAWLEKIEIAARSAFIPVRELTQKLKDVLGAQYERIIKRGKLARRHPGISQFTLANIKPKLRTELARRVLASADLITLNREASIQRTKQRMAGWASSVPAGGTDVAKKPEVKEAIKKGIAAQPFEERRVIIDQGHKLNAAINDIIATDGGAIAMVWHSHWREAGYNYRPEHKQRDKLVYLIRGSWADEDGYFKHSDVTFTDMITAPAEEPFCRCYGEFLYGLSDIPTEFLTAKGKDALKEIARAA